MSTRTLLAGTLAAATAALVLAGAPLLGPAATVPAALAWALLAGLLVLRPGQRDRVQSLTVLPGTASVLATSRVLITGDAPTATEGGWGMVEVAGLLLVVILAVRCNRGAWLWLAAAVTVTAQVTWILRLLPEPDPSSALFACGAWGVGSAVAVVMGAYPRMAAQRLQRSVESARRAQQRRLERDLHDFVAHDLSGIIVQAQAARYAAADDLDLLRAALRRIEESGQRAMSSMDRALELLRADEHEPAGHPTAGAAAATGRVRPQEPDLHDLPALVDRFRHAVTGRVRCSVVGRLDDVPPDVSRLLHRTAVEALTNVHRHAPGTTSVEVSVTVATAEVTLTVANATGTAAEPTASERRGGTGLRAGRARVESRGGTWRAGPTPAGWQVTAAVPLEPAVPRPRAQVAAGRV